MDFRSKALGLKNPGPKNLGLKGLGLKGLGLKGLGLKGLGPKGRQRPRAFSAEIAMRTLRLFLPPWANFGLDV